MAPPPSQGQNSSWNWNWIRRLILILIPVLVLAPILRLLSSISPLQLSPSPTPTPTPTPAHSLQPLRMPYNSSQNGSYSYEYARLSSAQWAAPCLVKKTKTLVRNPHTIFLLVPRGTPMSPPYDEEQNTSLARQKKRLITINVYSDHLAYATLQLVSLLWPRYQQQQDHGHTDGNGNRTECESWEARNINMSGAWGSRRDGDQKIHKDSRNGAWNEDWNVNRIRLSSSWGKWLRRVKVRRILWQLDKVEALTDQLLDTARESRLWPPQQKSSETVDWKQEKLFPEWWRWWSSLIKGVKDSDDNLHATRDLLFSEDQNTQRRLMAAQHIKEMVGGLRGIWQDYEHLEEHRWVGSWEGSWNDKEGIWKGSWKGRWVLG